jgi:uncharacterized protein (DUF58 family)
MSISPRSQVFLIGLLAVAATAAASLTLGGIAPLAIALVASLVALGLLLGWLRMWPGAALVKLATIPALIALTLIFIPENLGVVLVVDGAFLLAALGLLVRDAFTIRRDCFRAERLVNPTLSLGQPEVVTLTLENASRSPVSLRLRDDVPDGFSADPEVLEVELGGRQRVILEYGVVPNRRGSYTFNRLDALARRGRGFWVRALSWPVVTTARVYPDVRQITQYTLLARKDRLNAMGVKRTRKLGQDNEFERLRDYIEGDDPRHMDWRASARRQKLTVRGYQVNQSQRVLFLVDCGRMMCGDIGDGQSPLDHALNAMLMLAHVALVQGDQVGVLAYSDRIRAYVPLAGGPKRINTIVHSVHDVFPEMVESRHDLAYLELEKRYRKRSLVIHLTNVFDDVNAAQIVGHLGRMTGHHLPLGVFLRDQDLFRLADNPEAEGNGLYRAAAAASMLNWRERVLAGLRRRGVLTLDVFPNDLTAPLVNQYLEIKARHLL